MSLSRVARRKFAKIQQIWNDSFTLEEVLERVHNGTFQSFAEGDTWVVTRVVEFPRFKTVEVVYMVGSRKDFELVETKVTDFAKNIGAKRMFAVARPGFNRVRLPGWEQKAVVFSKELTP